MSQSQIVPPSECARWQLNADDGRTITAPVLIDGNHRAARCPPKGHAFFVYLLTEEETTRALLRAPEQVSVRRRSLTRQ